MHVPSPSAGVSGGDPSHRVIESSSHRVIESSWAYHGPMAQKAATIDQVIERLTAIVEESTADRSRLGYFAALYRKVTIQVKQGIEEGRFDDGPRMRRLDVIFASRYLDAFDEYRSGGTPTRSWLFAFEVSEQWWPIVLQHLLLGMNAHINLDLGIAAARTVPPKQLLDLQSDFNKINTILASLVGGVQEELAQIWVTLRLLNRYLGDVETSVINFSMTKARDHAWSVAQRMAPLNEAAQAVKITQLDSDALKLARLVRHPGVVGDLLTKTIRAGERGTIPRIIDILS